MRQRLLGLLQGSICALLDLVDELVENPPHMVDIVTQAGGWPDDICSLGNGAGTIGDDLCGIQALLVSQSTLHCLPLLGRTVWLFLGEEDEQAICIDACQLAPSPAIHLIKAGSLDTTQIDLP